MGTAVNVQDPLVVVAVNAGHDTGEPVAGVAVRVTTAPETRDETLKLGVSSAVLLSALLVPRSEATSRSGVPGVAGLIEIVFVDAAERFPAPSIV